MIKMSFIKKSFKVSGKDPCKILKSFSRAIARSTCIRACATLAVLLHFFAVNCALSRRKGGMTSLQPFHTSKSLMLNPLSAMKLSPGCSLSSTPDVSTIWRSDAQPP